MLQIGSVLDGKYKILNEIGHGGMSVVYLALNERANKTWAVKEVRKDGGNDNEVVSQGLIAETEMLKKLNHPNLPSIVDVIDTEDTFIIVMDYIEGRSLQSVLNHTGAQDPERVLEWSKQLCDVLGYLHSRQPAIIYRDMKPANVMLKPDGQVALIDFGTAREYKEHSQGDTTWLGTRGYAAPEQFGGRGQTDARTDIYCLGATMYHLLTGYSPADTQFVIYPLGQLIPSLAGSGLEKVVAKCCEPEPANRYQSCAELMYALEHVHDEDTKAIKDRNRKWRMFVASCVIAAVGLVGTIGFGITNRVAETKSYDNKLEVAKTTDDTNEKLKICTELMDIKPAQEDAYEMVLTTMMDPRSDSGANISTSEHRIIEDALSRHKNDFRSGNHEAYLHFQIARGTRYLSAFTGNPVVTSGIFEELSEDKSLDEKQTKLVDCLKTLSDANVNNEVASNSNGDETNPDVAGLIGGGKYALNDKKYKTYSEVWETIENNASDYRKIDELTGEDPATSVLVYRSVAVQLMGYYTKYLGAGVTHDQMVQVLEQGEKYIAYSRQNNNIIDDQAEAFKSLLDLTEADIEEAKALVTQNRKTDLGAGTAPSAAENTGNSNTEQ